MMNYPETLAWMFGRLPMYQRIGASAYRTDLHNTIALLSMLGNPEKNFRSVHIAGTNGKGSVSHLVASVLQEAGYKIGLYTSPHLKDFRERIRINGEMISENQVIRFVNKHKAWFEEQDLSFFEMTVGLAFSIFSKEKVDLAIIETGMGGRLDSTNLITPLLSVITNIGMDHTQYLGNTLTAIATEKAGIIKKAIPVVVGETNVQTKVVFEEHAAKLSSPLVFADQLFDARRLSNTQSQVQVFDLWKGSELLLERLEVSLLGHYQQKNIQTAMAAIDLLRAQFDLSEENIREGILAVGRNTGLMGRWQIMGRFPIVIADTAHNVDGVKEVVMQLKQLKYRTLHFVLGMVNDKNIDDVLHLLPLSAQYYFCKADIPRGLDAAVLASKACEMGLRGKVFDSVWMAFTQARNNADPDDVVFVGGSTFVVAEVV